MKLKEALKQAGWKRFKNLQGELLSIVGDGSYLSEKVWFLGSTIGTENNEYFKVK